MNLEALVARHARLWELKRRLEAEGRRPQPPRVDGIDYGPCLLISREHASGGDAIARLAGQRLGWPVYDRELVDQIAAHAHVRKQLIERIDERSRFAWQAFRSALASNGIEPETYLGHLESVVRALGHHGDVVLVGRGAHRILPSLCALRVRIVAPPNLRRDRLAAERGIDPASAAAEIHDTDEARASFHRQAFHRDVQTPSDYDLVLNTEAVDAPTAVEVVLRLMESKLGVRPTPPTA